MALPRTILHVDMDAFFASVEQRDHPEWRGKPVIVGAGPNERGVVSTCSYEARAYGVRSAMPSRTAAKLCPDGIFVPPDFKRYKAASDGLMAILGSFTPCVEPLSLDEAFLDVTGSRRLFGDGVAIAEAIRARVKEELRLTCSVGVAKNMFLAKLASDLNKPDGLTVVPREPEALAAFLAPLPVSRLWGAGPKAVAALARGPIRTFGELLAADGTYLAHLVGKNAAAFFRALARGEDDREVAWEGAEAKSISRETTFPEDERDWGKVEGALRELAEDVARRLRLDGRYAKTARLKIRWGDFETWTRQRPFGRRRGSRATVARRRTRCSRPFRGGGRSGWSASGWSGSRKSRRAPRATSSARWTGGRSGTGRKSGWKRPWTKSAASWARTPSAPRTGWIRPRKGRDEAFPGGTVFLPVFVSRAVVQNLPWNR